MNLFVSKQISFFGLDVTATDALAVSYLLGFNLLQEFYGKKAARSHLLISFLVSIGFVGLSLFHLIYTPNSFDETQEAFLLILSPLPRIIGASIFTFIGVQAFDITFFSWLRKKFSGKKLALRLLVCLLVSQIIDTYLFSFLALYGIVGNVTHIIHVSLAFKFSVIVLCVPLATLSQKVMAIHLPKWKIIHNYISSFRV